MSDSSNLEIKHDKANNLTRESVAIDVNHSGIHYKMIILLVY